MVAAVVAGDADGFAAVYDQYATSLYACCRAVLPEPEAAGAVLDTFLIATVKLDGLRDPDRLGPWLHAVARNECLRRLGPAHDPAAASRGSRRRAAGGSLARPARPGPEGVRRQLPGGPGAPDERGAPRGRVRPGGLPQGDRLVRAMVVATGAAAPRRGRGGGRGGGAGRDGRDHGGPDCGGLAPPAGLRPRSGRGRACPGVQHGPRCHQPGTVPGAHDPGLDSADVAGGATPARPAPGHRQGRARPRPPRHRQARRRPRRPRRPAGPRRDTCWWRRAS